MTRSITWRKWADPIAPLAEGFKQEEDEGTPDYEAAKDEFGGTRTYRQQKDPGEESESWNGPVTVIGGQAVPIHESNLPGQLFNLWMGDTTFDLTMPVVQALSRVEGVETLDVITRYRFRLGVGRSFEQEKVKGDAEFALGCRGGDAPPPAAAAEVAGLKALASLARSRFPHWAVVQLPDGRHIVIGDRDAEKAKGAVPADGQVVLSSWEG